MEEEESIKREAEEKRIKEEEFNLHRSGYIENLNGSYMWVFNFVWKGAKEGTKNGV